MAFSRCVLAVTAVLLTCTEIADAFQGPFGSSILSSRLMPARAGSMQPNTLTFAKGIPPPVRSRQVLNIEMSKRKVKTFNPFSVEKPTGWLSDKSSQKLAYSTLAGMWVIGGLLHFAVMVLLINVSVASHALFALAYCHFGLVISAILSLRRAAENNLLAAATYRRLNSALLFSGVGGLGTMLAPSVVKVLTASTYSASAFKILPLFSNSPLAVAATVVSSLTLFASIIIPWRIGSLSFVQGELKGLALANSFFNTVNKFFAPKGFRDILWRVLAVFVLVQTVTAIFFPATMLSLAGVAMTSSAVNIHAMQLLAASLVFQLLAVSAIFSSSDFFERGGTYKRLNSGFAATLVASSMAWSVASIPYASQSVQPAAVTKTKLLLKREPSVINLIESLAEEPVQDVAGKAGKAAKAAGDAKAGVVLKKMTLWEEASIVPKEFIKSELPKLTESAKDVVYNKPLVAYNVLSLSLAFFCAYERSLMAKQRLGRIGSVSQGTLQSEGKSGDDLFMLSVAAFKKGKLATASQYLDEAADVWGEEGKLSLDTSYASAIKDISEKINAAGGESAMVGSGVRLCFLELANKAVEQAVAATNVNDYAEANKWWAEAEMWYSSADMEPAE